MEAKELLCVRKIETRIQDKTFYVIFVLLFFMGGGYGEVVSSFCSIVYSGLILWYAKGAGTLKIPTGKNFFCLCLFVVSSVIYCFYAVDWGTAVLGVIKFFPVLMFVIAACQMEREAREFCIQLIPDISSAMVICAMILFFTPWRESFFTADRMGSFFQYPNTFALVLLLSILILLERPRLYRKDLLEALLSITGLLLSGSRSVFLLFIICLIYTAITETKKRKWIAGFSVYMLTLIAVGGILLGYVQEFARFTTSFTQNSTLWGRLLYWQDALQILKDHPFGLGYKGYYFIQGTYASGNYVTMYAHNELLQILLDFGFLGGVAIAGMLFFSLYRRRLDSSLNKKLLTVCVVHSLFDFDLQFLVVVFIILLLFDFGECKCIKTSMLFQGVVAAVLLVSIYSFSFLGLEQLKKTEAALKLFPALTFSEVDMLNDASTIEEKGRIADHILERNHSCSAVYRLKALQAASEGNFSDMEEYAKRAIATDPYNPENYEACIQGWSLALDLAVRNNDELQTVHLLKKITGIEKWIQQREENSSCLAFKIKDKPKIVLQEQYLKYIERLKEIQGNSAG